MRDIMGATAMGAENFGELLSEIKRARETIDARDQKTAQQIAELERGLNELHLAHRRPGGESGGPGEERADAIGLCVTKHALLAPIDEGAGPDYSPSAAEVDEALAAKRAIARLWRHGDERRLDAMERKSLSSFSFGNVGWILSPQISSTVLSCLSDPTDLGALMRNETISGPSLVFPLDNATVEAAWACEADCAPNLPANQLQNVGQIEIKPEPLRAVVCATSSLLADSSFDIGGWVQRKAARAFRAKIAAALLAGDGVGRPQGILNPQSGIPICDVGENTPAGTFTWQDLMLLRYQLPTQWLAGASYLMNARTLGLVLTMSDASGRPIWTPAPHENGIGMTIGGAPIRLVSEMPDVAPGATPVACGNWPEAYAVVTRSGLNMLVDPYSAGWCTIYKFEARVGGAVLCPAAARLLRVK